MSLSSLSVLPNWNGNAQDDLRSMVEMAELLLAWIPEKLHGADLPSSIWNHNLYCYMNEKLILLGLRLCVLGIYHLANQDNIIIV